MRYGPGSDQEFRDAEEWGALEDMTSQLFTPTEKPEDGSLFKSNSLSGGERNRMFFQRKGNFKEFTLNSGTDFREDGRGFILFDYDSDGYLDMGITSPNYPRFRILRNTIGDRLETPYGQITVSLVGGQTAAQPSEEWSPRDAYGTILKVHVGEETRMFQLSLGEGLSGQNAKRIHIGLGTAEQVDRIEVLWPSGKRTESGAVAANEHITLREDEK